MDTETIFRILLPILIIAFVAHRGYYIRSNSKPEYDTLKKRKEGIVSKIANLLGIIGLLSTFAYSIDPKWLAFASQSIPAWLRWTGIALVIIGFSLLQWAQVTLSDSWSDTPRMMKEQTLITRGPYR
ncbi:MAG TPA: hypothetical protein DCX53_04845, partial [Anaerolineae bacterium]|nr:hypothetical protein [Anaerolineae bacterium]